MKGVLQVLWSILNSGDVIKNKILLCTLRLVHAFLYMLSTVVTADSLQCYYISYLVIFSWYACIVCLPRYYSAWHTVIFSFLLI